MRDDALLARPLSEEEIEQLDDFLMSDAAPEDGMDVSMMNGFLTALSSGPNLMMPSAMLRWIWDAEHGEASPLFRNTEESVSIVSLIIRHWNEVNNTLNNALDQYEPLIFERESGGRVLPIIDEWCLGYYKGIAVDRAAWEPLMAQHPEWFTAITLYGTENGWDELKRRQDSLEQHQRSRTRWPLRCATFTAIGWSSADSRSRVAIDRVSSVEASTNRSAEHRRSDATTPVHAARARNTSVATAEPRVPRTLRSKATATIGR